MAMTMLFCRSSVAIQTMQEAAVQDAKPVAVVVVVFQPASHLIFLKRKDVYPFACFHDTSFYYVKFNYTMSWIPICADQSAFFEELCRKIHASFGRSPHGFSSQEETSLMYGKAGFALYYGYAYKVFNDNKYLELFSQTLDELMAALEQQADPSFNFGRGMAGICWGLEHISSLELNRTEVVIGEYKPLLEQFSETCLLNKDYDYLLGGLGYPFSLLQKELSAAEQAYVSKSVQLLEDISIKQNGYIYWEQLKPDEPGKINLGVAHGLPGILVYLSKCYQRGISKNTCEQLIAPAMAYLLQARLVNKSSVFPYAIVNNEKLGETPMRWCYGDMGAGLALILIGRNCNNPNWVHEGIRIGLSCVKRIQEAEYVVDAHICHGTAGLAHIFNRYYQYSGNEAFKEAAINCLDITLTRAMYKKNYIQFVADKGDFGTITIDGLMEGAAGIGLILMSAISTVEPKWDSCFLMS